MILVWKIGKGIEMGYKSIFVFPVSTQLPMRRGLVLLTSSEVSMYGVPP